jgi:hypothetical protein
LVGAESQHDYLLIQKTGNRRYEKKMRIPGQIETSKSLVRSWTVYHPRFYGEPVTDIFVDSLLGAEACLADDGNSVDPVLCRVLAAYHGPRGAKVPLSTSTVSGCVRPAFVALNPWLKPSTPSCYDGGCYLFHARAVPAKKIHEFKVRAHTTSTEGLLAAARLGRRFGLPIRDNQSSDGSMSMALPTNLGVSSQLLSNLRVLNDAGFDDVSYLCFSSAYVRVTDTILQELAVYPALIVHVTVSGWHSQNENCLRLNEFERYAAVLPNVFLRVVNRQDWAGFGSPVEDSGARSETWLLREIQNRGLVRNVIRTPFHSVHSFPGSQTGNLGSRHMAGYDYLPEWSIVLEDAKGECCSTGKCKSCPVRCGTDIAPVSPRNPLIAARAFAVMLRWESERQHEDETDPLGCYTARILARKAQEQARVANAEQLAELMGEEHAFWDTRCSKIKLTKLQRRRLANDSHALVVDGIDRHGLWKNALKRSVR